MVSNDVSSGDDVLVLQYNNLRTDVLDISSGHDHNGSNSKTLSFDYDDMLIKIQTGSATIPTGSIVYVDVTFGTEFSATPKVFVAQNWAYYISNLSTTGCRINLVGIVVVSFDINWIAVYTP